MLGQIGQGKFGIVCLAQHAATGTEVAVKLVRRDACLTENVEQEVANHVVMWHPHIAQFYEVFIAPNHLCIAMEYVRGGTLAEFVGERGGLEEGLARWFFQQIACALEYMHAMDVVNRDIKLDNILLDPDAMHAKICDFGYSKYIGFETCCSRVGTPGYAAPEILLGAAPYDGRLADVFSAGVLLFEMLFNANPFARGRPDVSTEEMLEYASMAAWELPQHAYISNELLDLLSGILVQEPARRYDLQQVLNHPWVQCDMHSDMRTLGARCLAEQPAIGQGAVRARIAPLLDRVRWALEV